MNHMLYDNICLAVLYMLICTFGQTLIFSTSRYNTCLVVCLLIFIFLAFMSTRSLFYMFFCVNTQAPIISTYCTLAWAPLIHPLRLFPLLSLFAPAICSQSHRQQLTVAPVAVKWFRVSWEMDLTRENAVSGAERQSDLASQQTRYSPPSAAVSAIEKRRVVLSGPGLALTGFPYAAILLENT